MDIRYQVFVSSTFRDLQTERQAVLDAVLELGHIPAGMEVFPAASATPWTLIRKIISESDYYILIIGGRYGSTDEHGISYTEREFDLAQELKIPTLVFLPADPKAIPSGKTELDPKPRRSLAKFRSKVEKHHCKFWQSAEELKAKVVLGLTYEIMANPRPGWRKGNITDSPETLKRLNELLEERNNLIAELDQLRLAVSAAPSGEDKFASGEEQVTIRCSHQGKENSYHTTWRALFKILAPTMMVKAEQAYLVQVVHHLAYPSVPPGYIGIDNQFHGESSVNSEDWKRVVLQFLALGYWEVAECTRQWKEGFRVVSQEQEVGYKLTKLGIQRFGELEAVPRISNE